MNYYAVQEAINIELSFVEFVLNIYVKLICIVIYKTSGISGHYHIPSSRNMNFLALGLFQSIRSYSCCALRASKVALSHSSKSWAA